MLPCQFFWDFNSPKVPFPGSLSHSDRIFTDFSKHFPDINLESLKFFTKNIFITKNLTDFRKTVESGMAGSAPGMIAAFPFTGVVFSPVARNSIPVAEKTRCFPLCHMRLSIFGGELCPWLDAYRFLSLPFLF